ncbi:hypothetical protein EP10_000147 [Geobacillus icigianus]|uniref:Uncharacterized protein n=1 Tax=Geobacillus icigianus TaxID=1430331 RepID=A0ABU6BBN0_9BACL|nr:hypothetical protein B4113_0994 [Geobacillus sp. B4113_201601]MEB3749308.1 hypothetical protein [Geobacillus icigianus]
MRGLSASRFHSRQAKTEGTPEAAFFFRAMNGQLPFANESNVAKQQRW